MSQVELQKQIQKDLEHDMKKGNYGMFSKKANLEVKKIIKVSKNLKKAEKKLDILSDEYPEAIDTAVKEYLYASFPKKVRK